MGGYFVDVCTQYPSVLWTHLQRPGICVQISRRFVTNILLRRCTAVTRYVPHIPGNISANVADGACLCICTQDATCNEDEDREAAITINHSSILSISSRSLALEASRT